MKAVELVMTIDVEERPCRPPQIQEIHVIGALTDEKMVYIFWKGEFYRRELAGLVYDEAERCYRTSFTVSYDEDIMTVHGFKKIKLSEDPNFKSVLETLLA